MSRVWRELLAYLETIFAFWPGVAGDRLRVWWISHRVAKWGVGGHIAEWVRIQSPERMQFGHGVMIGSGSFFSAEGGAIVVGNKVSFNANVHVNASVGGTIKIGDNCLVGPNVVFRSADHRFDRTDIPMREQGHRFGDIVIEDDVWLGANVVILGGVRVGKGTVVAAGAVVTRDMPSMSVVGGVPAKVLRSRMPPGAGA